MHWSKVSTIYYPLVKVLLHKHNRPITICRAAKLSMQCKDYLLTYLKDPSALVSHVSPILHTVHPTIF